MGELVSIIIPTYNRGKAIIRTLESAVRQTYVDVEIIVVDNHSEDDTLEIVRGFASSHPNVRIYQNDENIGPVRNWQKCVEYALGDFIKILWSDDLIAPTFIEEALPYIIQNPRIGFVVTRAEVFDDISQKRIKTYSIGRTGVYLGTKFIHGALLDGNYPVSPGCALFRKKDLCRHILTVIPNRYGIDFSRKGAGNDLLIYLLTAMEYPEFAVIDKPLSFFCFHKDSISVSAMKDNELPTLYTLARAYFVERYVKDQGLIRKFNARLLAIYLASIYNKKYAMKSAQDFYYQNTEFRIDPLYFSYLPFRAIFQIASSQADRFLKH